MKKDLYNQTILNFEKDYFLQIENGSFYDKFNQENFEKKRNEFTTYLNKRYKSLIIPQDYIFNSISKIHLKNLVEEVPSLFWTTLEGIDFFDKVIDNLLKENNHLFFKSLLKKDVGSISNISFWAIETPYNTLRQLPISDALKKDMLLKIFKNILTIEKSIEETDFSTSEFNELKKRVVEFKKDLPLLFNDFKKISKNNLDEIEIIKQIESELFIKTKKLKM